MIGIIILIIVAIIILIGVIAEANEEKPSGYWIFVGSVVAIFLIFLGGISFGNDDALGRPDYNLPEKGYYTVTDIIWHQNYALVALNNASLDFAKKNIGENFTVEITPYTRIYYITADKINETIEKGDIVVSNGIRIEKADKIGINYLVFMQ